MDGGIRSNAPRDGVTTRLDPAYRRAESEFGQPLTSLKGIKTKSLFSLMDLPAELRLKIYPHLLTCDGDITVTSTGESALSSIETATPHPSVAILQTCKLINQEGSPILYSENKFVVYLTMDPGPSFSLTNSFLLKSLRWSSIAVVNSISFISNSSPLPGLDGPFSGPPHTRPAFNCTGADIIARFNPSDFRYSPKGPDEYMALSISNWVSTQVMRVMLSAFQKELEAMMRPSEVGGEDAET